MMRDPKYFDRVEEFLPERFLEKVKSYHNSDQALNGFEPDDPSSIVFGFGRRYQTHCVNFFTPYNEASIGSAPGGSSQTQICGYLSPAFSQYLTSDATLILRPVKKKNRF